MYIVTTVVLLSSLFAVPQAHSWLECAKYGNANVDPPLDGKSYDINKCFGFGRNFERTFGAKASHTFGIDRGYNVQPGTNYCNGRTIGSTADYPRATYVAGEKVRLVWPAKNHDAEACTNPFIPDTAMKIYATTSSATNGPASGTLGGKQAPLATSWRLIADFKDGKDQIPTTTKPEGFQRCPDFCGSRGTDKAICFQDMQVPAGLPAGDYTFLWYWIFNQGSGAYTTCFNVKVISGGGTTSAPGTTAAGATTTSGGTSPPSTLVSLRIEIKNTNGVFDQKKLISTIATQLTRKECEVVTLSFSGGRSPTNQNTFNAFFGVSMQEKDYAAAETTAKSTAFATAIAGVTSGTNVFSTQKDGPVGTSCQTTTSSITRYTISMTITVALASAPEPGALSSALNQTVIDNGAKGDVSCVLQTGQTKTFICVVVVFSVADVIKVSNMANLNSGDAVKAGLATNLKTTSGSAAGAKQTDFTVSGAPSNVQSSPTGSGSRLKPWTVLLASFSFFVFAMME